MKTQTRKFRVWTYDVWGNARDGFEVNDRYAHGTVEIVCREQVFNVGTLHEFSTFDPTDRQLSRAAGFLRVTWDGSEGTYYAEGARNGRPVGELCEAEAQS